MKLKTFLAFVLILATVLPCINTFAEVEWAFEVYEAEEILKKNFSVYQDKEASGGVAVRSTLRSSANAGGEPGDLSFSVEAAEDCSYSVYVRVKFSDISQSFFCGMGNEPATVYYCNGISKYPEISVGKWLWIRFIFPRRKGNYDIKIRSRVPDVSVDKVVFTNHPEYFPYGKGEEIPVSDIFTEREGKELLHDYNSPPPYVPSGHPRVFVNGNDIERIKKNLSHPENAPVYSSLVKSSEGSPERFILEPVPEGIASNYITGVENFIASNAFLYLINDDEKAGRKAIDASINYVNTIDTINKTNTTQISRTENSVFIWIAAAYDWCYDLITEEEKRTIIEQGLLQLTDGEIGWPPQNGERAWNQGHWSEGELMNVMLAFTIAIYDEYPQAFNIVGGYIFNDFVPFRNYLYDNSLRNVIGTGYGREIYEVRMAMLLDKMGAKNAISPNFKYWAYSKLYERLPVGGYIQDGDHSGIPGSVSKNEEVLFNFAALYNDPFLKNAFVKSLSAGAYHAGNSALYLIWNNPGLGKADLKELPLSLYSGPLQGGVVARTGWDNDVKSDDMVVFMKTPENFFEGHAHRDAGQFQIYYKGMLAIDSGAYYAYNSANDRYYYKQTLAHNCILIDNPANSAWKRYPTISIYGGQNPNSATEFMTLKQTLNESKAGKVLGVDFGGDVFAPDYSYLKGDMTLAYNGNADNYTRSFVFFNFFDKVYPGALVVMDKVKANPDYKRTWLLHSQQEPEIKDNTQIIRRNDGDYDGRLINETILPSEFKLNLIGGDGFEYFVDGKNYPDKTNDESGKWRIEISPENPSETEYFLNVLQVSDDDDKIPPLETDYYETKTHLGIGIKDRVAFLSKSEKRTSADISIKINPTDKPLKVMVDGLREGTWKITDSKGNSMKKEADKRGGVIYFETSSGGEFRLTFYSESYTEKPLPLIDTEEKEVYPDYFSFKVNDHIKNNFDNPIILSEEGKPLVPVEEYIAKLGLSGALSREESAYKLLFLGKSQTFEYSSLEKIDGVYYIDPKLLEDVLQIQVSYNDMTKTLHNQTLDIVPENKIVNSTDRDRIKVTQVVGENVDLKLLVDDSKFTYYADSKYGCFIQFDFEKEENLKAVGIQWHNGSLRNYKFRVLVSVDGIKFEEIFNGFSSGTTDEEEKIYFDGVKAKHVKIIGYGSNVNSWNSIYEVKFYK